VGRDASGNLVGGRDMRAQATQVFRNIQTALASDDDLLEVEVVVTLPR
jgi:enamine deaminase RidA (YjgF/YER057c/UK114 family)